MDTALWEKRFYRADIQWARYQKHRTRLVELIQIYKLDAQKRQLVLSSYSPYRGSFNQAKRLARSLSFKTPEVARCTPIK